MGQMEEKPVRRPLIRLFMVHAPSSPSSERLDLVSDVLNHFCSDVHVLSRFSSEHRVSHCANRLDAGYAAWWDKIAKEDGHVVQVLQSTGAVFHARTTQPQV